MIIIKIGGGETINLTGIVADLATLTEPYLIVHGANRARDNLAAALKIDKRVITSVSGYSSTYSDESAIDLLLMAYAGLRNKRIVELCQRQGINAVGLCGLDGRLIQGRRNTGIRTRQEGKTMIVRDFSGKPAAINLPFLTLLLDNGYIPVLTVPICDEAGVAINSENDDIVALLQRELGAGTVVQLIEAPGFLAHADDPASVIPVMQKADLQIWEVRLGGRMKRKFHALYALAASTNRIIIADGRTDRPLQDALAGRGTVIT